MNFRPRPSVENRPLSGEEACKTRAKFVIVCFFRWLDSGQEQVSVSGVKNADDLVLIARIML